MHQHHTVTGSAPPALGLVQQHSVEVSFPTCKWELQCDVCVYAMQVHIALINQTSKVGCVTASLSAAHDLDCHSTATALEMHTCDVATS